MSRFYAATKQLDYGSSGQVMQSPKRRGHRRIKEWIISSNPAFDRADG